MCGDWWLNSLLSKRILMINRRKTRNEIGHHEDLFGQSKSILPSSNVDVFFRLIECGARYGRSLWSSRKLLVFSYFGYRKREGTWLWMLDEKEKRRKKFGHEKPLYFPCMDELFHCWSTSKVPLLWCINWASCFCVLHQFFQIPYSHIPILFSV